MKRLYYLILVMIFALPVLGCETAGSKEPAASNHREDQATRQTERDLDAAEQRRTRKPMDTHKAERQNIIDQPR